MARINIAPETQNIERDKAALEALAILKCCNISGNKSHEVDELINRLALKMMVSADDFNKGARNTIYATKIGSLKWLIENSDSMMSGSSEKEVRALELAKMMRVHSCVIGIQAAQGESFTSSNGEYFSIVASCPFCPNEDFSWRGFFSEYYNSVGPEHKEKRGMDSSSMRLESERETIVRIRRHDQIPVTYMHWDYEMLNHVEIRAKMSGKIFNDAKKFFQMQAGIDAIGKFITQQNNENEHDDKATDGKNARVCETVPAGR